MHNLMINDTAEQPRAPFSSTTLMRLTAFAALLIGGVAAIVLSQGCEAAPSTRAGRSGTQPIQFNHNLHTTELEMDCQDCHRYVREGRKASLPDRDVCFECHEEMQGESAEEEKLVTLLATGQELDWQRVYVLPKHVYFSHLRHVTLGQIGCQECHGDMMQLTAPPRRPAVDIIDMDHCIDCHEERQADNDCLACHS